MKQKDNMPSWAYWGLWGIESRKIAFAFLVISLIFSCILIPVGIIVKKYILLTVVLVPIWYWAAIKWADDNEAWDND